MRSTRRGLRGRDETDAAGILDEVVLREPSDEEPAGVAPSSEKDKARDGVFRPSRGEVHRGLKETAADVGEADVAVGFDGREVPGVEEDDDLKWLREAKRDLAREETPAVARESGPLRAIEEVGHGREAETAPRRRRFGRYRLEAPGHGRVR